MGRHGTGGSEDAQERGESAFWGPDNQRSESDSFWGNSEQQEAPGWPSLPDQPEVTGQWAPMPQRDTPPPAQGSQSDPFEVTGAFQVPPRPGEDRPHPQPDEAPFESTGAFARPPSWDDVQDSTQTFTGIPGDGAFRQDDPHAAGDPQNVFQPRQNDPFSTGDTHAAFRPQDDPFSTGDTQAAFRPPQDDPFGTGATQAAFRPSQDDPFGGGDAQGGFRSHAPGPQQDAPFGSGEPRDQGDPFGAEATGRFEPPSLPPEPGDVKVAGSPTSVAPTPAWAEAETGFLGSGWTGGDQDDTEPRRGRRKPPKDPAALDAPSGGGRGRMALLSVAAVVVVLGGTVAGVKMMSSGGDTNCPGGQCAAVQGTNQPVPVDTEPAEEEDAAEPLAEEDEETPVDEAAEEDSQPEPTVSRTYAPAPRRTTASPTPTPTPTPTRTKSKTPAQVEEDIDEPVVEEVPEEVTAIPSSRADADTGSVETHSAPPPEDTPSSEPTRHGPLSGGAAVNVRFRVERQALTSYTATMSVTNESPRAMNSFTLSMPVRGKITGVEGAEWTQDGNLLIVDLTKPIAAGESADLRISATGRAGKPSSCGLVGGECSVA